VSLAEKNNSKGFTLVEVAVVLVVLGLIVGAVVSGEQLISGAQTNRAVAQVQAVTAAYLIYVDRYRAIPGDDPRASSLWPEAKDGSGDGLISGPVDAVPPGDPSTLIVNATEGENLKSGGTCVLPVSLTDRQTAQIQPYLSPMHSAAPRGFSAMHTACAVLRCAWAMCPPSWRAR
jgi:prepilin-type N-terminal cleavage/methylation domain-containing protein